MVVFTCLLPGRGTPDTPHLATIPRLPGGGGGGGGGGGAPCIGGHGGAACIVGMA